NADYKFEGIDFKLIHFEEYGARTSSYTLSKPLIYHTLSFKVKNPIDFSTHFSLKTYRAGIANGLRLNTSVVVAENIKIGGSPWFNPPLILPFEDIPVKSGDEIEIDLSYGLGAGFSSIKYDVHRL
ncbi:MAG: hypothetical protein ABIL40_10865, partial [candidate division WOR-3 bacterium]